MEKGLKSDSAAYLKSWLQNLHEDPKFLKTILPEVKRSVAIAEQRIDKIQMDIDNGIESEKSVYDKDTKALEDSFVRKGKGTSKTTEMTPGKTEEPKPEEVQEEAVAKEVVRHGRGR